MTLVAGASVDERAVREVLASIVDPEIPVVSIVDLGIVHRVEIGEVIRVELLPTFVGCPALEVIEATVRERLGSFGRPVAVTTTFAVPWTSDRITHAGREALRRAGFSPPGPALIALDEPVRCPHCGSKRTVLENAFGPTRCRSIRFCSACRQPFESFKPV